MSDLRITDFKVSFKWKDKLIKIITPFSLQFWLTAFLIYCYILINRNIISNTIVNVIYVFMCFVILFY
jgi:hypothetical protein